MKKTRLKKIGAIGLVNREARQRIAEIAEDKNLNQCEIKLDGCLHYFYLAPAHKHKRAWYQGSVDLLADYNEWVVSCQSCHTLLDGRSTTSQAESDAIFDRLRPSH